MLKTQVNYVNITIKYISLRAVAVYQAQVKGRFSAKSD